MQNRWSRGRSKERGRKSPGSGPLLDEDQKDSQSDYAADNSSDHSSSATPLTQSPRHRAGTIGDSPLAKPRDRDREINGSSSNNINKNEFSTMKTTMARVECEPSTSHFSQQALDLIHVSISMKYSLLIFFLCRDEFGKL